MSSAPLAGKVLDSKVEIAPNNIMPSLTAGGNQESKIPRNFAIKRINLHLRVSVTLAAGGTTPTSFQPMRLLRGITIKGSGPNGERVHKSFSGEMAYLLAAWKRRLYPYRVNLTSGADQAASILEADIPLDFYAGNINDSTVSLFPAYAYTDPTLIINWGVPADIAAAGVTINSAVVTPYCHQLQGVTGDFLVNEETEYAFNPTATSTSPTTQMFDLPNSGLYKALYFLATTAATGQPPSNAVISQLLVRFNGSFQSRLLSWADAQGDTAYINGLPTSNFHVDTAGTRTMAANITNTTWNEHGNPPDGTCMVDFAADGGISGLVDGKDLTKLEVLAAIGSVANTPLVKCATQRFIP